MNLLNRLWSLLSVFGPAPAADAGKGDAKAGVSETRQMDRGPFDSDEPDEAEEPEAEESETEEEPEAEGDEQPADDEPEEDAEGEEEQPEAAADEEDGEDEEDDEGEDADEEDDDTALSLRESWETRLAAEAAPAAPRIDVDRAALREEARKRFAELRDKGENGEHDAEAMFEVALDAALQVVGSYHHGIAAPTSERVDKTLRNVQVSRSLASFRREVGERLTPAIEQKMAEVYTDFAQKHGWRKADKVPLKHLFRMAGGRMKGSPKKSAEAKPADDTAKKQKREALAAAGAPRSLGRTRPEGKKAPKDRALVEFAHEVRERRPFFSLSAGR